MPLLLLLLLASTAGANFSLQLRSPCLSDMVEGVMAAESAYEHWGLLHRLQRVLELLDNAEAAGVCAEVYLQDRDACPGMQQRTISAAVQFTSAGVCAVFAGTGCPARELSRRLQA